MTLPRKPQTKIEHGTNRGYAMELRRGKGTCKRCRKAHAMMRREHRERTR